MRHTPANEDKIEKLEAMKDTFTYLLYNNVCRSLLDEHKMLFSFSMTAQILFERKEMDRAEFN